MSGGGLNPQGRASVAHSAGSSRQTMMGTKPEGPYAERLLEIPAPLLALPVNPLRNLIS